MSDTTETSAQGPTTEHSTAATQRPFLRIIKGNPDDQQVAALTTVFAGLAHAAAQAARKEQRDRNWWGNHAERLRSPQLYNPNAFRNVTYY